MAWATGSSGSQTATISTEHQLVSATAAATYLLAIDLAALAGGATPDILELRIYGRARAADTERLIDVHTFVGVQSTPLFISKPYPTPHSFRATITQTQGTGRSFPWATYEQ